MSRLAKLSTVGITALLLSLIVALYVRHLEAQLTLPSGAPRESVARQPMPPACEPIELSGILRRPGKSSPVLELVPAGRIRSIIIGGAPLGDLPAGTPIRVKGVVRSSLHTGGTKENLSPFPPQWYVSLVVTELEILDDPMIMLERKRGRQ